MRPRPRSSRPNEIDVLIVSEDPALIHHASQELRDVGMRVVGCLGPAHSRCKLEDGETCSLARKAHVALVDSPSSGAFICHWKIVPSGDYAKRLQRAHPECKVILCGAPEGSAGASGEVIHAAHTSSALLLLRELAAHDRATSMSAA